uniref:Uncharacterized protein n=1 Tax=Anguilla anguilla TaxID=7936 RepID=A0A0E9XF30_ANGAN
MRLEDVVRQGSTGCDPGEAGYRCYTVAEAEFQQGHPHSFLSWIKIKNIQVTATLGIFLGR